MSLPYSGLPLIAEKILSVLEKHGPLTVKQISDGIREFNEGYRVNTNAINRALREQLLGKVHCIDDHWSLTNND